MPGSLNLTRPFWGSMLSELYSPNAPRLFAAAGFDFILVDCEHGPFDYSQVAAMAACAAAMKYPFIVRIPRIDRECILKYLEMGATGLLVPMVETAEEAATVVSWAKYAPLGKRGISTRRAHNGYMPGNLPQYMEQCNLETLLFVQIETSVGVTQAANIAAINGIDGLIVGPSDLSSDLGCPGALHSQAMVQAIDHVADVAAAAGRCSGIICSDIPTLRRCMARNMYFIGWSSELSMICACARDSLSILQAE